MATAQTIIDRALRLLGVIASGESPTAAEGADGLTALNAMIDSWRNDRLMVYSVVNQALTLTGAASYTLGPTGGLVISRPVKIESAYCRVDGVDYPVDVVTKAQWDAISDKSATGDIVTTIYYDPTHPNGTLYAYPLTSNTLYLGLWTPLGAFAAVGDTVSLPPGYERALAANLAIEAAPEYEREPSSAVVLMAKESKAAIKRINSPAIRGMCEFATGSRFDIRTGQ